MVGWDGKQSRTQPQPKQQEQQQQEQEQQDFSGAAGAAPAGAPPARPPLRAFLYCLGQGEVYDALWRAEDELVERLVFVTRLRDADVVLHRLPLKGERQFALDDLRRGAKAAGIPFLSVHEATGRQLGPKLRQVLRQFDAVAMELQQRPAGSPLRP